MCIRSEMYKINFKNYINFFLIYFIFTSVSFGKTLNKIEIIGNDRIADETILMFSSISEGQKIEDLDLDAFLHCNDLTYLNNGEEELNKYKKGDKINVKVLEIKTPEQKIRVGLRQTKSDPFDWFKDKSKNQTITVKVVSTDNKGLIVRPEGCEME